MTILEFLSRLRNSEIEIWSDEGELCYNAPNGALTPALRTDLVERKAEILAFLNSAKGAVRTTLTIQPVPRDGELPLSFAQQRLWFLDQWEPGNPVFNIPVVFRLTGPLDVNALERSLAEIVRRHESLRTTFAVLDGNPIQVITDLESPLSRVNLCPLDKAAREAEVQRLIAQEMEWSFDLARGPLARFTLVRLEEVCPGRRFAYSRREKHILLLNVHHIVFDGWSVRVFKQELTALYRAFSVGEPTPFSELPTQYADFAAWQRERLQGEELAAQLAYWKRQLGDAPPSIELPKDHPRPPVQSYLGENLMLRLSKPLSEALGTLSRREGCTLFMTLLAAFKVLLYRYTGQGDIVVGSPIAGRNRPEIEETIGFFLNTLALRTDLSDDPTFLDLLDRVRGVTLGAYAHQDVPFEKLLEELRPERVLGRTPLFQVFFNMLNLPTSKLDLSGLLIEGVPFHEPWSKFDLTLYALEREGEIWLDLVFSADLFTSDRMTEMLEQFQHLLSQIADNPGENISRFSLVTPTARPILPDPTLTLPSEWKDSVQSLFSCQARQSPERPAVVDERETWTYKELDQRSNQLAHYLRDNGIQAQDTVAIYAHRSASLVWAVMGVLKAGAAFVILDSAYPAARLIACLRAARPQGWLQIEAAGELDAALKEFVDDSSYRCRLTLPHRTTAEARALLAEYSTDAPVISVGLDDLAYVAFTSGSTGTPKGILGRHGPLSHFLPWQSETFGLDDADRYSMLSGLSHDPLQRDIFTPLALGATLCIPAPEQIGNPGWLAEWMERERISVAHLTPAMIQLLTQTTSGAAAEMPSLRYAFTVGDVLTRRDVSGLRACVPAVTCVNYYGSTETQRAVGHFVVPGDHDETAREVIPLGRGIWGVQLLVLNAAQQLAGVGELGEIHVRSPHMARGYLDDDALTRERFIANPFTGEPGDRLYRTGDLGRYLPNGSVEFEGRADDQVKIRGFRIELGEVESTLSGHPAVRETVIVAASHDAGKRLIAYVVPRDGDAPTTSELNRYLRQRLPDYMLPSAFVTLESLPLTPNGKVDRRALPAPDGSRPELAQAFTPPRTPVEQTLAGVWTQLLGLDQVGVHDNFFDLGGHSLLATQLVSRLRDALKVELSLHNVFETPTIAGLAETIAFLRQAEGIADDVASPICPIPRDGELPLSFAQQRMWFLDQLEPGSPFYNLFSALRLTGPLSAEALERSLGEIVRRHESLRTTFAAVDGLPRQVILPAAAMPLPVMDLQHLDESAREVRVRQLAEEEARRPFDLTRDLPLRATLLRLAETEHVLLLTMHHIASDGWSMGVLVRELVALYPAFCAGQPCPLPELPVQYADFATWQRGRLRGDVLETQLDYWKRQLGGSLPVLELPSDRPRPAVRTVHGARQTFTLPQALSEALETLSRQESVTPFMTLLAALKTLLSRYTGQDDVIVGSPIANRNRTEIESLIGFFANTLVLRTDLSGAPTFRELLERVREVALGAYEHQELPFEKLVEELEPERDLSRTPLFQVLFALQNAPMTALELPNLTLRSLKIDKGTSKFDLSVAMWNTPRGMMGWIEYNTDLFDAATITRLLQHFQVLLENVVADPDQAIADVPILTETEREQLAAWNDTATGYPDTRCVHELFEVQVEQHPTAVAVAFEGEHYTYRELNRRANQVAHHLQALGVGPDARVGLFVERSLDVVVGLLGILKAGGAYVPLDPIYPPEHISDMLRDAQSPVLLTQAHLADDLSVLDARVVCLDRDWDAIARNSDGDPPIVVDPSNLMYVLFTSGSTGRPKGVAVEQRNFLNYIHGAVRRLDVADGLSFAIVSTFAADLGLTNVFGALCTGGQVHVIPYERAADPDAMSDYFRRHRIDAMKLVPSHLEAWQGSSDLSAVIPRQRLVLAGEASHWEMIERVRALSPGCVIQNHYGPTETTVSVLAYPVPEQRPAYHTATVPLGRPLGNVRIHVLNARMQPVPVGVPGELCIGGASVTRGYLDRPALTAASFVPDPFGAEPGSRLYRSGDRARYLPDGNVEFLGRIDQQIKIRGYRVEPGGIETLLVEHPSVQDAVVSLREDTPGDKRLVAYVVPHPEHTTDFSTIPLRDYLRGRLADYAVPSVFVALEEIPLNPNGKVNRQALPVPGDEHVERECVFVAPSTPFEEILAEVWEEVLRVAGIGVHDNFFDLGGHSLLATQVVSRVRDRFEIEMPVRFLFEAPTVAEMGLRVEEILVAEIDALDDEEARNQMQPGFLETRK